MFTKFQTALLTCGCLLAAPALALNATSSGSGNNSYLFIDNAVDREYFITTSSLDPRFTGANVWTKFKTDQTSLGYMGYGGWSYSNRYFDFWIDDSPIDRPFQGIRCRTNGSTCPSTGFIAPDVVDRNGIYHTMSGSNGDNGSYAFGSFSSSAYEYFRSQTVGSSDVFRLNLCYLNSKGDYDYASGTRCKDLSTGGYWRYYTLTMNKVGHLTLNSTGAMAEIWVASDGSASVNVGSELCEQGVVSGNTGLVCKMVSYSLQQTKSVSGTLDFRMVIDEAMLGFKPSASDVRYSGNGSNWSNYTLQKDYDDIFTNTGQYVYVFLSDSFFRKALAAGTDLTNKDSLFTFYFDNSAMPQSGYYQFTPSTLINIIPREYGISIISSDGNANPRATGRIGDDEEPITFEYTVTTSAARQADSITAQVKGNSTTLRGVPYCLFTSADSTLRVPIPAYLSWTSAAGNEVRARNSCSEDRISLNDARWIQTAWNANIDDGFFFATTLKLLFPMNDSRTRFTVDGHDWMGNVSASGEVEVTALWRGVDR